MSVTETSTRRKADMVELADRDEKFRKRVKEEFPEPKPYRKDDPIVQYVCIVAVDLRTMVVAYVPRDELTGSEMERLKYVHRVGYLKPEMHEEDFLLNQLHVAFKLPIEAMQEYPLLYGPKLTHAHDWEEEFGEGEYGRWHKYVSSPGAVSAKDVSHTFVYYMHQPRTPCLRLCNIPSIPTEQ